MKDHYEKVISEINQKFQNPLDGESNWQIAQDVIRDIGGIALNIGGTNLTGDQPGWGRSSMSDAWIARYHAKKYHAVDPFIAALVTGASDAKTDCGTLKPANPAFELNHDLKAFGYCSLYASMTGNVNAGYRSIVTFCSDQSLAQLDATIGFGRLKIIHAIIAANTPTPHIDDTAGRLVVRDQKLTQKESDILCWLASGLRNDQIAFKAGIAEVTVRKHLISIRRKLAATTREQAIAIAMRDAWIVL